MKVRLAFLVVMVMFAACGDDDTSSDAPTTTAAQGSATTVAQGSATTAGAPGAGRGSLTLGDETIQFDSVRCYLEAQESAGGGGSILATGQGSGVNAAGEAVVADFTRYDENSDFHGDDLNVTVGDPFSGDAVTYSGSLDMGSVAIVGNQLSGTGFTLRNLDDGIEVAASFEMSC